MQSEVLLENSQGRDGVTGPWAVTQAHGWEQGPLRIQESQAICPFGVIPSAVLTVPITSAVLKTSAGSVPRSLFVLL